MRYILTFIALLTFSFALASSVMLVHVTNTGEISMPIFSSGETTTAVQGYVTLTVVHPDEMVEEVPILDTT